MNSKLDEGKLDQKANIQSHYETIVQIFSTILRHSANYTDYF